MDSNAATTFMAPKGSKDIIKIVQSSFYDASRILFVHNENKKNDFNQVEKLGTWTILSIFLLPVWALNVVVLLLCKKNINDNACN